MHLPDHQQHKHIIFSLYLRKYYQPNSSHSHSFRQNYNNNYSNHSSPPHSTHNSLPQQNSFSNQNNKRVKLIYGFQEKHKVFKPKSLDQMRKNSKKQKTQSQQSNRLKSANQSRNGKLQNTFDLKSKLVYLMDHEKMKNSKTTNNFFHSPRTYPHFKEEKKRVATERKNNEKTLANLREHYNTKKPKRKQSDIEILPWHVPDFDQF